MKIKDGKTYEENQNNSLQQFQKDNQKEIVKIPIFEYLPYEELSSIMKDFLQTKGEFLQLLHCNNLYDTQALTIPESKKIAIPDVLLKRVIEDSGKAGHSDNPGKLGRIGFVLD